jgi:hypothetical protein
MKINEFQWNNYKETQAGKETLSLFSEFNLETEKVLINKFLPDRDEATFFIKGLDEIYSQEVKGCNNPQEAEKFFIKMMEEGISADDENLFGTEDYSQSFYNLPIISLWLYSRLPNFYIPYFFSRKFFELTKIADNFLIDLPQVPLKKDKYARLKYYWDLCVVLKTFQKENNLNNAELCAFLYDYAPKFLGFEKNLISNENLPQPSQIWLVGGDKYGFDFDFLDNANSQSSGFWQGNVDTKRGDIVIMYCLAPRSVIHSVWRATSNGIADPFFYFYGSINIGVGIKTPPIHISELKSDKHFSLNPLVRKNLQGINGYSFSSVDYQHLLSMFSEKGFDISQLPKLYRPEISLDLDLKNERDVEINLVEPLLERLDYNPKDWIRQMSVRMGRGERNYPDYAFFANSEKGYEKAKMLIETKFFIKTNVELEETFKQARSYAVRLEASILIICDKECLWFYEKINGSFDRSVFIKKYWGEVNNPDDFRIIKNRVGKERVIKL